MLSKTVEILKPFFLVILIVTALQMTGIMSSIGSTVQSAALGSGFMNASANPNVRGEDFDYNFTVIDMDGKTVNMEDFKGKVVFLNLWATWCGPCRAEMPTIQKLYSTVPKENVAFLILSVDYDQDVQKIEPFIKKQGYTFPVYHRPMKDLSKQLQLPSIPATFVIAKNGKVLSKEIGMTNFNTPEFRKLIEDESKK